MTRTFIALELNSELQSHLRKVIAQVARLLPDIRWVNPAGIHLTLSFLGELTDQQLAEARRATERTARITAPFSYSLSGIGMFGNVREPRVIWMGIEEPTGALKEVHRILNQDLKQHGFEVDTRPFAPHFTLARIKGRLTEEQRGIVQEIVQGDKRRYSGSGRYEVRAISVMKSESGMGGVRYTSMGDYEMGKR